MVFPSPWLNVLDLDSQAIRGAEARAHRHVGDHGPGGLGFGLARHQKDQGCGEKVN